jgi:hypothetical protein
MLLIKLSRNFLKTFLLILKILQPDKKIHLFKAFASSASCNNDESIVLWFPMVIELCIPFLKDDNRLVRKCASDNLAILNSTLSQAMDRAPTINRRREAGGILEKLQNLHSNLARSRLGFPNTGARHSVSKDGRNSLVNEDKPKESALKDSNKRVDTKIENSVKHSVSKDSGNTSANHDSLKKSALKDANKALDTKIENYELKMPEPKQPTSDDYLDEFFNEDEDLPQSSINRSSFDRHISFEMESMVASLKESPEIERGLV